MSNEALSTNLAVTPQSSRAAIRRLEALFNQLAASERATLLAFAEFLVARTNDATVNNTPTIPRNNPRPAQETVVAAMQRLSATYFMLERQHLFDAAAALMSAHVLQGRPSALVIDELQTLFETQYRRYLDTFRP